MWDEDLLSGIIAYLPHEPHVLNSVAAMNPRMRHLIETHPAIPRCAVSVDGSLICAFPSVPNAYKTHVNTMNPSGASGNDGGDDDDVRRRMLLPRAPRTDRILDLDNLRRVAGKEPFEALLRSARVLRDDYSIDTGIRSLHLSHCRRLLPQLIPKAFITELCSNHLASLTIEGMPMRTIDAFIRQLIVQCGPTLVSIDLSDDNSVNITPSTVAQIEARCHSLRHLVLPTNNAFLACAAAKLVESHPHLHTFRWSAQSTMSVLPAVARHCKALRAFENQKAVMWRMREQLPLVKLVMQNNISTLRSLAVDCGDCNSITGKYLATLLLSSTVPLSVAGTCQPASPTSSSCLSSLPSDLVLRLESLSFREGPGIQRGLSSLRYFAAAAHLTSLSLELDTLLSLATLPMAPALSHLAVKTGPGVLPPDLLFPARRRFEAYLLAHRRSLTTIDLSLHAAYPELLSRCLCFVPHLSSVSLSLLCPDYRYAESVEEPFTDATIYRFLTARFDQQQCDFVADVVAEGEEEESIDVAFRDPLAKIGRPNLRHFSISGYGDETTFITDTTLAHLAQHCPRLESIVLQGLGGTLTDLALSSLYDHPTCPRTQPLFSLKSIDIGGGGALDLSAISYEGICSFIKHLGSGLERLRLSRVVRDPVPTEVTVGEDVRRIVENLNDSRSRAAAFPSAKNADGDGEEKEIDCNGNGGVNIDAVIVACARHCPDLQDFVLIGFGGFPRPQSLLELKRGCRLVTVEF